MGRVSRSTENQPRTNGASADGRRDCKRLRTRSALGRTPKGIQTLATVTIEAPSYTETAGEPIASAATARTRGIGDSIFRGLANFSVQPLTWAGGSLLAAAVVPRFLGSDGLGQLHSGVLDHGHGGHWPGSGITTYLTRRIAQNPRDVARDLGVGLVVQLAVFAAGA